VSIEFPLAIVVYVDVNEYGLLHTYGRCNWNSALTLIYDINHRP
jgi:hypothetical protein